jgi:hypothetical protein
VCARERERGWGLTRPLPRPLPRQWVPPPGWADPAAAAAGGGAGAGGLGEWAEHVDPDSGVTYYYNARTQESRWDRPA